MEGPARSRPAATRQRRSPGPASWVTRSHVRLWLAAVAAAILVFTTLYWLIEGWSAWDGLYMTIITLTTVGFREVHELDNAGRAVTMAASLSGAALIFGGVGIMAETLLSEIGSGHRERRRMERTIADLHDHLIVCGYGRVGSTVARQLRETGRSVVVIDILADSIERARHDGYLVVEGDATEDATLRAAGVDRARALVTTTDSDANNVYVVLSSRAINPALYIVGRANTPSAEPKLTQAGADRVVSPYTMAGRRIAELAVRPALVDFIDAALSPNSLTFALEADRVDAGGPFDGRTVGELRDRGIFVLAVVRGPGEYDDHPPADRRLGAGDELILSAPSVTLREFTGED